MGLLSLPSLTSETLKVIVFTYTYITTILLFGEILSKKCDLPLYITRKIIHTLAGTWMFISLYLFEQWEYLVLTCVSFIVFNFIFLQLKIFRSMDPREGATLGTVYFPISCAFLIGYFHEGWENGFPRGREYLAIAGIMAMTFGDASASVIGKTYGRRGYQVIGTSHEKRTYEGSLAFFIFTLLSVSFFWSLMSPPELDSKWNYFWGSLISASVGTFLESISPMGTDNLTVPVGVSFILSILGF
ncbi:15876_t:CDS:2 [Acaulospora morrowiae]|uniref:15876_t:CDS:1 n=1 Tax=Acaulospora morrowiae TaxID=94023 RepID=A0A9N8YTN6_9GLOM|nr:15876_t:CDS:2 [Acaulospora morrowiae]